MSTSARKLPAIFPDLPRESNLVDKNGEINNLWNLYHQQNNQALQQNFKSEGIMFPIINQSQADQILAIYTPFIGSPLPQNLTDISGQTIFNTDLRMSQQFIITFSAGNIATVSWRTFSMM